MKPPIDFSFNHRADQEHAAVVKDRALLKVLLTKLCGARRSKDPEYVLSREDIIADLLKINNIAKLGGSSILQEHIIKLKAAQDNFNQLSQDGQDPARVKKQKLNLTPVLL